MKKYFIVVNKMAQKSKAEVIWVTIKDSLDSRNIDYIVKYTTDNLNATKITTRFIKNLNRKDYEDYVIIAIGGNGTLVDTLNGIKNAGVYDFPLAFIPVGFDNEFAKGIGLSFDPLVALDQILNTTYPTYYDIGKYREVLRNKKGYFLNSFGIGMDAFITNIYNKKKKRRFFKKGFLAFLTSSIEAYFNQEAFSTTLRVSNSYQFFKRSYVVNIANHPYFEGNVSLSPFANVRDHNLDLMIIENMHFLRYLIFIFNLYFKKQIPDKKFHRFKDNQIHLIIRSLEFVQIDGEEQGSHYLDIYFTSEKYPFWFDINSVPILKRK